MAERRYHSGNSPAIPVATATPPASLNGGASRQRRYKRAHRKAAKTRKRLVLTLVNVVFVLAIAFCVVDLYVLQLLGGRGGGGKRPQYIQQQQEEQLTADNTKKIPQQEKQEKPKVEEEEEEVKGIWDDLSDEELDSDKERIYQILRQAGIRKKALSRKVRYDLPTWSQVVDLYGSEPVIHGLERCHEFSDNVEKSLAFFGVAGIFNSGTNLLAELLIKNCQITERMLKYGARQKGMRWQVPWGKHTPVKYRESHVAPTDRDVPLENSFPMIAVRDPYQWMRSMCRHIYTARWNHNLTTCPNLWPNPEYGPNPLRVKFQQTVVNYKSLPAYYNDWYREYLEAPFPRVFVRFEDLLFHAQNVTRTLCQCGGGVPRQDHQGRFLHVAASAKVGTAAHGKDKTNLLQALIRYGKDTDRTKGMTPRDLEAAPQLFDKQLLEMFRYRHPQK